MSFMTMIETHSFVREIKEVKPVETEEDVSVITFCPSVCEGCSCCELRVTVITEKTDAAELCVRMLVFI